MKFLSIKYDFLKEESETYQGSSIYWGFHNRTVAKLWMAAALLLFTCRSKLGSCHSFIRKTTECRFSQSLSFPGPMGPSWVSVPFSIGPEDL